MSQPNLDNTIGASFIGVIVAAALYGVSCVQVFYYYRHYNKHDGWAIKTLVGATWACDTVHQMLISHTVYTNVITNYNNPDSLNKIVWSLIVEVLFNGVTALLVQSFFVIRIWRLSNFNKYLTVIVSMLVLSEFISVVLYVAKSIHLVNMVDLDEVKALSMAVNVLAVAGDVLIAAVFCTMLHRSRTGFKRSDTMINLLIMFSVNTGLLTSLCAIASLVSIIAAPNTYIYICFYFLMGRLYCNSLLATLNARKAIRNHGDNSAYSLSLRVGDGSGSPVVTPKFAPFPQTDISIQVETTRHRMGDEESLQDVGTSQNDKESNGQEAEAV